MPESTRSLIAVTHLGLGTPTAPALEALLIDPSEGGAIERLDVRYPGSPNPAAVGEFIVSAAGDIDGDGHDEIVYGVTSVSASCHLVGFKREDGRWRAVPITDRLDSVRFIRSLAVGDLDGDGRAEMVLGTRPDGAVVMLNFAGDGYVQTTVDRDQYGPGTTNTREVAIGDADNDGVPEIVVATARTDAERWQATPGSVFAYKQTAGGWQRTLIDDHQGRTHSRMADVGDAKSDGVNRVISCELGIYDLQSGRINPEPVLRLYTMHGTRVEAEEIGPLEKMIKSRSFALGDVDGDGRAELVVGTRSLTLKDSGTTCLYVYYYDRERAAWRRETIDTSPRERGFHCVAVADVDGDGRAEVIASDDGLGLIKLYKKYGDEWDCRILYSVLGEIFCASIHAVAVRA